MNKVFLLGSYGSGSAVLKRRLAERSDIELLEIPFSEDPFEKKVLSFVDESDLTFLCMNGPDSARFSDLVKEAGIRKKIISTGVELRVRSDWTYGLPEYRCGAQRAEIAASDRVVVPGCHASGFILPAEPLLAAGIFPRDYPFAVHSVTGYSGGGKALIDAYQDRNRPDAFAGCCQYYLDQDHFHLPEMQRFCALPYPPILNPIVADYYAGMTVTTPVHTRLLPRKVTPEKVRDVLAEYYADQPLIEVLPFEKSGPVVFFDSTSMTGRDDCQLAVYGNDERFVLLARFDNLGKGAGGSSEQLINIALGLPEETHLSLVRK